MKPCKTRKNLVYDIGWAHSIVKKMYEKYARATDFLGEHFELNSRDIALFLARNDGFWPIWRDCTHKYEHIRLKRGDLYAELLVKHYTTHMYSEVTTIFPVNNVKLRMERLTDFREFLTLNSQGFKGGLGREGTPDRSKPTLFSGRPKEFYIR